MTELVDLPPIEHRHGGVRVDAVDVSERLVTVIAVPYNEPAQVMYRSEVWNEIFMRGALDSVAAAPHRVRVNRGHDKERTVGKVMQFWPDREEGLVAEIRVAKTPLGDETLALAEDDCLSLSVGYGVRLSGQELDRRSMTRRINKAYLDHLSFVESPAFAGAKVLSVRDSNGGEAANLSPLQTPLLDQFAADDILRWASERLNKQ